jgi:hypothetical protein
VDLPRADRCHGDDLLASRLGLWRITDVRVSDAKAREHEVIQVPGMLDRSGPGAKVGTLSVRCIAPRR